ncbi:MAG TPA: ferric reductase-like transmembrane domain-containing protein, partial [Acidimicrobiales bacterium]
MSATQDATRWASRARRVAPLRSWSIRPGDIVVVAVANAVLITAMWLRHGGMATTLAGAATAAGQLTALLGTYAALLELVLLSRSPFLDHVVGTDRLVGWHRWVGFACLWLVCGHVLFTTLGWAASDGSGVVDEL